MSVGQVIDALRQVIDKANQISACLRHAADSWSEAIASLRATLAGSHDPEAETLLTLCTASEEAFHLRQKEIADAVTAVEAIITRLRGEPQAGAPVSHAADSKRSSVFRSQAWVEEIGRTIAPATTKVTTAISFDSSGSELVRLTSGRDGHSAAAQAYLARSHQYPKPPGWRDGMLFATSEHAETKHAMWMRTNNVRHATVIINHPRVCGPPYGCEVAVRTILPRGWTMTVISSESGQNWTLRGVAEQ